MTRKTKKSCDEHTMTWKVGVYIRLSKEDGNAIEDMSLSILNQKKTIECYLEQFSDPYQLIDYYIDDGYTGTDSHRESFQRLLSAIRKKHVDCVIVKDLSRISRNYWEAGQYLEEFFVTYNVRFISLSLPEIDSYRHPESMTSISVPIMSVFNDDFAKQTSLKVRKTFDTKRKKGEFIGAFPPYGYMKSQKNKNRLLPDQEAAKIVTMIFHWFVYEGMNKGAICKKLNELGFVNPMEYKRSKGMNYGNHRCNDGLWTPKTISDILKNQIYIGHMVQGKQRTKSYKVHDVMALPKEDWFIVEHTHEAIIDSATFDKAQALQSRDTRTSPKENTLSLFAGLLKCADCGKALSRTSSKGIVYYVCRTHREKLGKACTRHSIREDVLQEAVLIAIKAQIALACDIEQLLSDVSNHTKHDTSTDLLSKSLQEKQDQVSNMNTMMDTLYLDWKHGDITKEMYARMKLKLEEDLHRTKQAILVIKEELCHVTQEQHNSPFDSILNNKNIVELDRGLLICLIDTIYVHEDKHITICFSYSDPLNQITS